MAKNKKPRKGQGKVGSSRKAEEKFGGKLDFGVPARNATRNYPEDIEDRPDDYRPGRSGAAGERTAGVGGREGAPGSNSGGDLDPDFIGLDKMGGMAAKPASGRTQGPDITTGGSGAFASGPPAKGEGSTPRRQRSKPGRKRRG